MFTAQADARQRGYDDYYAGKPFDRNPYQFISHRNQGPMKQAAWSAGWKDAEAESGSQATSST